MPIQNILAQIRKATTDPDKNRLSSDRRLLFRQSGIELSKESLVK
jgi:hypothetical protein